LRTQNFLTVVESGPKSFGAFAPDIQGCIAFSESRDEVVELFKLAAESHLRELAEGNEVLPTAETKEIPGLIVGVQSGAVTLEWIEVAMPVLLGAGR
jgi:predicted RNase H-like HicB family nuclease